jgi:hypothetical protein
MTAHFYTGLRIPVNGLANPNSGVKITIYGNSKEVPLNNLQMLFLTRIHFIPHENA